MAAPQKLLAENEKLKAEQASLKAKIAELESTKGASVNRWWIFGVVVLAAFVAQTFILGGNSSIITSPPPTAPPTISVPETQEENTNSDTSTKVVETASPDTLLKIPGEKIAKHVPISDDTGAEMEAQETVRTKILQNVKCTDEQKAKKGMFVAVNYTGYIYSDGIELEKFASSDDVGSPLIFQLGSQPRTVIKGLEHALAGACAGQVVEAIIPPELAYGDQDQEGVPKQSTLQFHLSVISISDTAPGKTEVQQKPIFQEIDEDFGNGDGYLAKAEIKLWFDAQQAAIMEERARGSQQPLMDWGDLSNIIQADDTNEDGKVSWDEFSGPKQSVSPMAQLV